MSHDSEIARIEAAYREYDEQGFSEHKWSGEQPGNREILAERAKKLRRLMEEWAEPSRKASRLLDLGCGSGHVLRLFAELGFQEANLYGIDLLPERIEQGRKRFPGLHLEQANGAELSFADGFFDFIVCFTLFSSILDEELASQVAQEASRVLAPGGAVIWYDFRWNNPRNAQVRGVGLREIRRLFPGWSCSIRSLTVIPPLARRLGSLTHFLYPVLAALPFLRTHYLGILRKPGQGRADVLVRRSSTARQR